MANENTGSRRINHLLDRYLQEIGAENLLSADEEIKLSKLMHEGGRKGERARLKLIRANLRFVVSVAKQYQNQGLSLSDLINEGNVGLIKAAHRFDETRGFKFISYAVWWIKQSILQALAEQSRVVRLPLNKVGTLNKISKARVVLEKELEREPTTAEIARVLEVNELDVTAALNISGKHLSIDAPFKVGENNRLLDVLKNGNEKPADEELEEDSLKNEVHKALSNLGSREREIITLYYGLNQHQTQTLEEIGERFKLTRERVRQIKEKAIKRLRHSSKSKTLKVFLG